MSTSVTTVTSALFAFHRSDEEERVALEFRRRDIGKKGGWFLDNPDAPPKYLAEITYEWEGEHLALLHTGVRDSLKGKGVARQLVETVVAAAREEGFLVIPRCPYARRVMRRDPKMQDVLVPGILDELGD